VDLLWLEVARSSSALAAQPMSAQAVAGSRVEAGSGTDWEGLASVGGAHVGGGDDVAAGLVAVSLVVVVVWRGMGLSVEEGWQVKVLALVGTGSAGLWRIVEREKMKYYHWEAVRESPNEDSGLCFHESVANISLLHAMITSPYIVGTKHNAQCVGVIRYHPPSIDQAHALCGGFGRHGIPYTTAQLFDGCRSGEIWEAHAAL
jgi:hypothetical protein